MPLSHPPTPPPPLLRKHALVGLSLALVLVALPIGAQQPLKHLSVSFKASQWETLPNVGSTPGPVVLMLRGTRTSAPTILFAEWEGDVSNVNQDIAYAQVEANMRKRLVSLRPSKAKPVAELPKPWTCGHYEAFTPSQPDVAKFYSQCVLVSNSWWAYVTVNTTRDLSQEEDASIKAVLASVRYR